jgi:hypothetical protein
MMMMSTMELEGLRTDTPRRVKRYLWSPRHWVLSLASLLVASCGDLGHIPQPAGDPPQDASEQRDAAVDAPVGAAADASIDAPRECDTAELACTGKMYVYPSCNGQCWALCDEIEIPSHAQVACQGWDGVLGEVNNIDDQACVTAIVKAHLTVDPRAWLGLHQAETASMVDKEWTWNPTSETSGTSATFTRWADGQPDDGRLSPDDAGSFVEKHIEQCMNVDTSGLWHDGPCTGEPHPFVCGRR